MSPQTKSVASSLTMQGLVVIAIGWLWSRYTGGDVPEDQVRSFVARCFTALPDVMELLGIVVVAIGRLRASKGLHVIKPWCVLIALCAVSGQALADELPVAHHTEHCQPLRGIVRGVLPHVLIVGTDGVRQEIRGQRSAVSGQALAEPVAHSAGSRLSTLDSRPSDSPTSSLWTWSASGQAHHAAVVRMNNPSDGSGGSGVYCQFAGRVCVLTCAHLEPRDKLRVTFADGTVQDGVASVDKFKHDICFVIVTPHPTIVPAPIAAVDVRPGEQVEFCTYGGPDARFRHFLGNATAVGDRLEVATPVTHGDSGAPVFNLRGEVIGIQSVGMGATLTNSRGFNVYERGGAVGLNPLTQFVGRCFGGQCAPQQSPYQSPGNQSPGAGSGGGVDFYPPPQVAGPLAPVPPPQVVLPSNPQPGPAASCPPITIDYDRLSQIVLDQLQQDIAGGKYPQLTGPAGPPGTPASIDVDALVAKLPPVVLSIDGAQQSAPLGQPIKLQNQQRKVR